MILMICNLGINKFSYKYFHYQYVILFYSNFQTYLREFPYEYIPKSNPYRPKLFEELDSNDLSWYFFLKKK